MYFEYEYFQRFELEFGGSTCVCLGREVLSGGRAEIASRRVVELSSGGSRIGRVDASVH